MAALRGDALMGRLGVVGGLGVIGGDAPSPFRCLSPLSSSSSSSRVTFFFFFVALEEGVAETDLQMSHALPGRARAAEMEPIGGRLSRDAIAP